MKKKKGYKKYMEKKKMLSGKMIAEIAPAKEKHQVTGKYNFNKDFLLYPPLTIRKYHSRFVLYHFVSVV